jgi:hypothetical protein
LLKHIFFLSSICFFSLFISSLDMAIVPRGFGEAPRPEHAQPEEPQPRGFGALRPEQPEQAPPQQQPKRHAFTFSDQCAYIVGGKGRRHKTYRDFYQLLPHCDVFFEHKDYRGNVTHVYPLGTDDVTTYLLESQAIKNQPGMEVIVGQAIDYVMEGRKCLQEHALKEADDVAVQKLQACVAVMDPVSKLGVEEAISRKRMRTETTLGFSVPRLPRVEEAE